jgi:hypothetical protein
MLIFLILVDVNGDLSYDILALFTRVLALDLMVGKMFDYIELQSVFM